MVLHWTSTLAVVSHPYILLIHICHSHLRPSARDK